MRRPLFGVCLCLVAIVVLWRLFVAVPQDEESAEISGEQIVVTGQVYQKNNNSFVLTSISIYANQNADESQQTIPWKYNIICKCKEGEALPLLGSTIRVQGTYYDYVQATNP